MELNATYAGISKVGQVNVSFIWSDVASQTVEKVQSYAMTITPVPLTLYLRGTLSVSMPGMQLIRLVME
jgi:hypothetical protein